MVHDELNKIVGGDISKAITYNNVRKHQYLPAWKAIAAVNQVLSLFTKLPDT